MYDAGGGQGISAALTIAAERIAWLVNATNASGVIVDYEVAAATWKPWGCVELPVVCSLGY